MIRNFEQLINQVQKEKKRTIAVAMAEDRDVLSALEKARAAGLANAILTGDQSKIRTVLSEIGGHTDNYEIIDSPTEQKAVANAVDLVRKGGAQVLMKGYRLHLLFLRRR